MTKIWQILWNKMTNSFIFSSSFTLLTQKSVILANLWQKLFHSFECFQKFVNNLPITIDKMYQLQLLAETLNSSKLKLLFFTFSGYFESFSIELKAFVHNFYSSCESMKYLYSLFYCSHWRGSAAEPSASTNYRFPKEASS